MNKLDENPNKVEILDALNRLTKLKEEIQERLVAIQDLKARIARLDHSIEVINNELNYLGYERD